MIACHCSHFLRCDRANAQYKLFFSQQRERANSPFPSDLYHLLFRNPVLRELSNHVSRENLDNRNCQSRFLQEN